MRRKDRRAVKFALIFLGLLFLLCLFLGRRTKKPEELSQPEGEKILREDVAILLEALGVEAALFAGESDRQSGSGAAAEGQAPEEQSGDAAQRAEVSGASAEAAGDFLTYGKYLALVDALSASDWQLPDFGARYQPEHALLKEDWYAAFRLILAHLNPKEALWETTVFLLKVDEAAGEAVTESGALQGANAYRSSAFADNLFRELQVYVQGDVLLTIVSVLPVEHDLRSVWVLEDKDGTLDCFYRQTAFSAPLSEEIADKGPGREQVADLTFREGRIVRAGALAEKIHGRLLRASEEAFEIEGHGVYPLAKEAAFYRLYGQLISLTLPELRIGCADSDFVVADGEIRACLVSEKEAADRIRVLLKNTAAGSLFHEAAEITVDGETVSLRADEMAVGERLVYRSENLTDKVFVEMAGSGRADKAYRGSVECLRLAEGLVLVNELPLEEYLYAVVPSEMPASYPMEALKAQAVCARTYACRYILRAGLAAYGAHVDDSTSYQVYHNLAEQGETTTAVKETDGMLLTYQGEPADNYYYSTSCGAGTDMAGWRDRENLPYLRGGRFSSADDAASGDGGENGGGENVFQNEDSLRQGEHDSTEKVFLDADTVDQEWKESAENVFQDVADLTQEAVFRQFIETAQPGDLEREEPWYRWTYQAADFDEEAFYGRLRARYQAAPACVLTRTAGGNYAAEPIRKAGWVKNLQITERGAGGVAKALLIETEKTAFKVLTEYHIRALLCDGKSEVRRQDGSKVKATLLLPSGFFVIDLACEAGKQGESVVGYTLTGGGYGHGVGMSQNGAKALALRGASCGQILERFYPGCSIEGLSEDETP